MGGVSSRIEVETEIKNQIKIATETFNKILSETTTEVNTRIVNENKSQNKAKIACNNSINISNINIREGINLIYNQTCDQKLTSIAYFYTGNNSSSMNKIFSDIAASIASQLSQKTELNNDLAVIASIQKTDQQSGEINNLISKFGEMWEGLTGNDKSNINKTKLVNDYITSNNITNDTTTIVKNLIKTDMSNNTINTCLSNVLSSNEINLTDISAQTLVMNVNQSIISNQFNTCAISNLTSNTLLDEFTQQSNAKSATEIYNDAQSNTKVDVSATQKDSTSSKSFADIIGNNIMLTILGIGLLVVVMGIAFLFVFKNIFKRSPKQTTLANSSIKYILRYYNG